MAGKSRGSKASRGRTDCPSYRQWRTQMSITMLEEQPSVPRREVQERVVQWWMAAVCAAGCPHCASWPSPDFVCLCAAGSETSWLSASEEEASGRCGMPAIHGSEVQVMIAFRWDEGMIWSSSCFVKGEDGKRCELLRTKDVE